MIPPVYNESLSAGLLSLTPHLHRRSSSGQWLLAPRELHPSEDLSELPPLRSVVAGQEYHYLRTRSLRGSLPKLLLDGWVPLVTLLGRLYAEAMLSAQVVFAHPPHRCSISGSSA